MTRVAFMQWIRPGSQAAYVEAHRHVWPEVVADTQAAGLSNYTGFVGGPDGRLVVGYFETPDLDSATRALAQSDANTRWSREIVPLMETGGDLSNGSMSFLTPIWRID